MTTIRIVATYLPGYADAKFIPAPTLEFAYGAEKMARELGRQALTKLFSAKGTESEAFESGKAQFSTLIAEWREQDAGLQAAAAVSPNYSES